MVYVFMIYFFLSFVQMRKEALWACYAMAPGHEAMTTVCCFRWIHPLVILHEPQIMLCYLNFLLLTFFLFFFLQDVCVPLSHLGELISRSKKELDASPLLW